MSVAIGALRKAKKINGDDTTVSVLMAMASKKEGKSMGSSM